MRIVRASGALAALALAIVGTPIALASWGVSPMVLLRWSIADDGMALLGVFTLAGWASWLVMLASVLAEIINLATRRRLLRLPGLLSGVQLVAGMLILAVVATLAGASAEPAQAAGIRPSGPEAGTSRALSRVTPNADPTVARQEAVTSLTAESGASYEVQPGDDLWSISEALLGDGRAWRLLTDANPELSSPTAELVPGMRLRLPNDPPAGRPVSAPHRISVARGDTLSSLAERHLGRADRWPELFAANRRQISDPDLIRIGWHLIVPAHANTPAPSPGRNRPVRRIRPRTEAPQGGGVATPAGVPSPNPGVPNPPVTDTPASGTTAPPVQRVEDASDTAAALAGGVGALAAAMMLSGLAIRRQAQLRARRLGQRIPQPGEGLHRYETALARRERPELSGLLERVLRHLGSHFERAGEPPPPVAQVIVGDRGVRFVWSEPTDDPPPPFEGGPTGWRIGLREAAELPPGTHPVPYPALVTLGCTAEGDTTMIDLEQRGLVAVTAAVPEDSHAVLAALAIELSCSPWAEESALTVVGLDDGFVRTACPDRVVVLADAAGALTAIGETVQRRHSAFPTRGDLGRARIDPDRGETAAVHVFLIGEPVGAAQREHLDRLRERARGVAVVLAGGNAAATTWHVERHPTGLRGVLRPDGTELPAQEIPSHTRQAVAGLNRSAEDTEQSPAPWWRTQEDNVRVLSPRIALGDDPARPHDPHLHPELRIVGPVELVQAAGVEPPRARRQCEEYCGWLLENPGRTATQMATQLLVAEGTRRSNMSRLRSWLGNSPTGEAYLPEAYSGRIRLDARVTSDWQRMQVLVGPGVNRLPVDTLREVLGLVRGAPLADAAPGQWHWAETLRTDISSVIRDAGVVLARKARAIGDLDLARWAAARALLAAPEDELLLGERIRTEHRAGNRPEVERLVFRLTRHARSLGIELAPETVALCQEAIEGRPRARA